MWLSETQTPAADTDIGNNEESGTSNTQATAGNTDIGNSEEYEL